ncbi:MAG: hypothetical protein GX971_10800 [Firmicutes bacterium]|nr:hypothetical protein [Bacillota bacterium]
MKKWVLALAVLMVIGLGSSAMAAEVDSKTIDFTVDVAPAAKFEIEDNATLTIADGSAQGSITLNGMIETNFPWRARISTTRVAEGDINSWFWYECFIGGSKMFGGNPGAGVTYRRPAGVNDVEITLSVPSNKMKDKPWYDLMAGTYTTSITITIETID